MDTAAVSALLVDVCARVVLPRFRALADHEVEHKRPGDLVTIADREAEAEIGAALAAAMPGALIVGEEASFSDPASKHGLAAADHAWVIDPVDGTRNFAHGSRDFGVMLAEVRRGFTTRSWIWQPLHDRLYVAERGAGATVNGTPLPRLAPPGRPWRVALYARPRGHAVAGLEFEPTRGACAIDYSGLAEGRLDALVYRSVNPWDHLPGALIVSELGGCVLVDGTPYAAGVPGRPLVAAASEEIAVAVGTALAAASR